MHFRIKTVARFIAHASLALCGAACAVPRGGSVAKDPRAESAPSGGPVRGATLEDIALAARNQKLGCQGNPGLRLAEACSVTLSLTSCAPARSGDIACCTGDCAQRIEAMTPALVEAAAQECAGRAMTSPARPVCEVRLPRFSLLRRDYIDGACLDRCHELLSQPSPARPP